MANHQRVLVEFRDVMKSYDGRKLALDRLKLEVYEREFLTLLGPSGSGKTTTLQLLAGFQQPTSGEIFIDQKPVTKIAPHRRNIGVVFQNYALFPHMSVERNIAYPLQVRRLSRSEIQQRVRRALDTINMSDMGSRLPAQLSGGQQQRVAVARALVFEPSIVLMDEPLGALDRALREQLKEEIAQVHVRTNATIVYVTHDQDEALTLSERVAVFKDGVIQQLGAPRELYENPATAFVASFVGENNQFDGVTRDAKDGRCLVDLQGLSIWGSCHHKPAIGDKVKVSIRPENIGVEGDALQDCQKYESHVVGSMYHGDHARIRVSLSPNVEMSIKMPASRLNRHQQIGDRLPVYIHADHALVHASGSNA